VIDGSAAQRGRHGRDSRGSTGRRLVFDDSESFLEAFDGGVAILKQLHLVEYKNR
jgi:hypothetical protein